MAKPISNKRPDNFWKTLRNLLHYMGNHRFLLLLVAILVAISALANLLGTYMLKPIVNEYIVPRDVQGLFFAVLVTAGILQMIRAAGTSLRLSHPSFSFIDPAATRSPMPSPA